jgi:hypothetical protein
MPLRWGSVEALDEFLATPSRALVEDLARAPGDIMVLGVGGKMGPTLARLAKNAAPERRVIGVARFSDKSVQGELERAGVETITADLLDRAAIERLPRVPNIVFTAGHKFGASGNPGLTWAMNALVPALVAESFRDSRIVAFSTGNVYPLSALGRPRRMNRPGSVPSVNMPSLASGASGCSSTFPADTARRAGSFA